MRRAPAWVVHLVALVAFVAIAVVVRGAAIGAWDWVNPDEAEIVAQARAAMLSPVPWSTWTLGTVGPFLVLTLSVLGWLGFPLTLAFVHLLAAVVTGLIGYGLFILTRREHGILLAAAVTLLTWLPLALAFPLGGASDFAAFSTEYLPCLFLVLAALVPTRTLVARPAWFIVVGLLGTLAVGSKYQVAPLVLALGVARLLALEVPLRRLGKPILFIAIGVAIPALGLGLMLLTPAFDAGLLVQNVQFVGSYAIATSALGKLLNTVGLLAAQPWLLPAFAVTVWLAIRSTPRVAVARAGFVIGGFLTVLAGGMGYAHYAIFAVVALGLAISLPTRDARDAPVALVGRRVVLGLSAVVVVVLVALSATGGRVVPTSPAVAAAALSPASVVRDADLERACPPGSDVLVWGWAPELYVHYSWRNTVPFLNPLGTVANGRNMIAAEPILAAGVDAADCVVDAVGAPFFGAGAYLSLLHYFPSLESGLEEDFRVAEVLDCQECVVYVRR